MYKIRTFELGDYRGRAYYLTIAVEPDPDGHRQFDRYEDANEWCVSIHYPGGIPNEPDTEIARIDTAHGSPHFHRLFSRGQPTTWLSSDLPLAAAEKWLASEWAVYAEKYEEHHGDD